MPSWVKSSAAGLAGAVAALSTPAQAWRLHEPHVLGTRLDVVVAAGDESLAKRAGEAILKEIGRLDAVFNTRRPDSEISRLNVADRMAVSPEMFHVLSSAEQWRQASGGGFDGRLGRTLGLWEKAGAEAPDPAALAAARAGLADPVLDATAGTVARPAGVSFDLDAIAKGYIIDAALEAGRRAAPEITGLAVSLGGDLRCWGQAPGAEAWDVGVADPAHPFDNGPPAAIARLSDQAIATSGRGMRDWQVAGRSLSCTVDPRTGRPVEAVVSATAVADTAMDADALATACMAMSPAKGLALAERSPGTAVRIVDAGGRVHVSSGWNGLAEAQPARLIRTQGPGALSAEQRWPADWRLRVDYQAPDRQDVRDVSFRTPFLVVWISDLQNKPIRTLMLIGDDPEWHKDNFVWWGSNRAQAERFVRLRSRPTARGGTYEVYWDAIDDAFQPVPVGNYILHVETSQERGKHTLRSLPFSIGKAAFQKALPFTKEGGGMAVTFSLVR